MAAPTQWSPKSSHACAAQFVVKIPAVWGRLRGFCGREVVTDVNFRAMAA